MQAIYSAASGLKNQQTRLDTVAANIANSSTVGYKSARVDFKDALYTAMDNPAGSAMDTNLLAGSGVLVGSISSDFADGALKDTGSELDFAISGSGFFTVENPDGEILYTRNGSFGTTDAQDGSYLVTAQGYYVLDSAGNRISLPKDLAGLRVTSDGRLSTASGSVAALGIAEFTNPEGLLSVGNTCFQETAASGRSVSTGQNTSVVQGSLEASNVDMSQEMTLLIRSQRAYSLASKALQTADDMEGLANDIH
ncbi:Flagellar basal-body rod protein FlgG [bioreactor metagenome]|uniref:Flagellar basal-body rod protein FlgG n=1 Tax=bioreactor metagenome TaxID=1076179 RepID=A0A644Z8H8_9ZZZZ